MPHVDPDILALTALGEPVASEADRHHLGDCGECAATLEELRTTATVGRASKSAGPLLAPPARVWDGIAAELGLASDVRPDSIPAATATAGPDAPVGSAPRGEPGKRGEPGAPSRPAPLAGRRTRRGPVGGALLLAAAVIVVGVLGVGLVRFALRAPEPEVLADAELEAFPGWPGASGAAVLQELPDGTRQVTVTLDADVADGNDREVWLIRSDAGDLVSIGTLVGATGTFEVPDGVDVEEFNLVDVSDEPRDGDPAHSGDSIVRGPLA